MLHQLELQDTPDRSAPGTSISMTGVRRTRPAIRAAAASMSSRVGVREIQHQPVPPTRQVDAGDHAARRPSGQLDGGQRDRHQLGGVLDDLALVGTQRVVRPLREHEHLTVATGQLDRVAREVEQLLVGQADDVPTGLLEPLADLLCPHRVGHRLEPDQRERGGDAHQHVGVVDRPAGGVRGVEVERLEVEVGAEPLERDLVGPVGPGRVGDPGDVVEDHRSGPLQEEVVELQPRVVDDVLDAVVALEHLDDVAAALTAAVRRVHRVDRDVPARMGGEPVVREDRVGGVPRAVVLEEMDLHPDGLEALDGRGDLGVGRLGDGLRRRIVRRHLEDVVLGGLRVGDEPVRPHHDHRRGRLDGEQAWHGASVLPRCRRAEGDLAAPGPDRRGGGEDQRRCRSGLRPLDAIPLGV